MLRAKAARFATPEDFANASCHFFGGPLANWRGVQKPIVAGYWPMSTEFDCRPVMGYLHEAGYSVALPIYRNCQPPGLLRPVGPRNDDDERLLSFRRWTPGMALEPDSMGLQTPPASSETLVPDIVIAPLLAFTRRGDRIGYGGGYYDATIAALRDDAKVIISGLGYAAQEVKRLPVESHDQPLDWIVTESFARRAER